MMKTMNREALVADGSQMTLLSIRNALKDAGVQATLVDRDDSLERDLSARPFSLLIVDEDFLSPQLGIAGIRTRQPDAVLAISSHNPSLAKAVKFGREGADIYFPKPLWSIHLLSTFPVLFGDRGQDAKKETQPVALPSLERIRWEYVQFVLSTCGSIRRTSELIDVPRRTLQRFLGRPAPPR
jgi:ActR/RegA family two-component response regulator